MKEETRSMYGTTGMDFLAKAHQHNNVMNQAKIIETLYGNVLEHASVGDIYCSSNSRHKQNKQKFWIKWET